MGPVKVEEEAAAAAAALMLVTKMVAMLHRSFHLSLGGKGVSFVAVTTSVLAVFGIVLLAVALRNCRNRVAKRKMYAVPQEMDQDNDDEDHLPSDDLPSTQPTQNCVESIDEVPEVAIDDG